MSKLSFRLLQVAPLASALFLTGLPAVKAATMDDLLAGMEEQSPVDIRPDNTFFRRLAPLQFSLSSDTDLSVLNTGSPSHESAIKANILPGAGSVTVDGHTYNLAQFHFHTPSEHLESSKATPLELHMVFADSTDNLLVVGRWINQGSFNSALDPIFSDLPTASETHQVSDFNLNSLLPDNLQSFRYEGSLTTPPFTEEVTWINLAQPLEMAAAQIQAYRDLFPHGNTRPVQPLGDRIILTDVPGFVTNVPEPQTYAMFLAGLGLLGFMSRRSRQT
ncbi:carbonic anhydrase family protein [Nitrosospira sp. Is2]|uniref:carbonic anhydrase family protein n=1 Tax=Nitrosospira sp. Is2 TaxID=3080532 RepID=UPI002952B69B|nr:carbonic anhydrase family protein [Nitrosospira sp. Is2]WON74025.1 carbonic anhydrase family protein [Nitrosospira sp. Is2]